MSSFARTDTSLLGRWWWTIDRWTLLSVAVLMGLGAILILAASPAVSERIGLGAFSLAKRQLVLLPLAGAMMFAMSLLSPRWVRRAAVFGFLGSLLLMVATLMIGTEIKGATRWINLGGFSLQPSEFVKPCFAVEAAWMFALGKEQETFAGAGVAFGLWTLVVLQLLLQPDFGQAFVVSAVFGVQFFLAGLPMLLVAALALLGIVGIFGAYFLLPHAVSYTHLRAHET